jgi:hypothetical protein
MEMSFSPLRIISSEALAAGTDAVTALSKWENNLKAA